MIRDIHLQNFRSYKDESFEFENGVNIVVGPNTSGKTNLLESILYIARGNSYRAKDIDLIRFGQNQAKLSSHTFNGSPREANLLVENETVIKNFNINGKTYKRLNLNLSLPLVLFEPNQLITSLGSPDARRNTIDELLERLVSGFGRLKNQYMRSLAQRNHLLKSDDRQINDQIFAWDIRLSSLAGQIVKYRLTLLEGINNKLSEVYSSIAKQPTKAKLSYQSSIDTDNYETMLVRRLQNSLEIDRARGFTTIGPHRDDLAIKIGSHNIGDSASRGEARSLLLAIKIIEATMLEETHNLSPILLLDDVFSELDGGRRYALTDFVKGYQTFISTTDADVVVQHFGGHSNIVALNVKS